MKNKNIIFKAILTLALTCYLVEISLVIARGHGVFFSSRAAGPANPKEYQTRLDFGVFYTEEFIFKQGNSKSSHFNLVAQNTIGEKNQLIYIYASQRIKNLFVICASYGINDTEIEDNIITFVVVDRSLNLKYLKPRQWYIGGKYGRGMNCAPSAVIPMPGSFVGLHGELINTWSDSDIDAILRLIP